MIFHIQRLPYPSLRNWGKQPKAVLSTFSLRSRRRDLTISRRAPKGLSPGDGHGNWMGLGGWEVRGLRTGTAVMFLNDFSGIRRTATQRWSMYCPGLRQDHLHTDLRSANHSCHSSKKCPVSLFPLVTLDTGIFSRRPTQWEQREEQHLRAQDLELQSGETRPKTAADVAADGGNLQKIQCRKGQRSWKAIKLKYIMTKMILETKTGIPDNSSQQISDLEELRELAQPSALP